jgi:hypothetical protein
MVSETPNSDRTVVAKDVSASVSKRRLDRAGFSDANVANGDDPA